MNEQVQEIRYLVGEAWKGVYNSATTYGNANVVQDPTGLSVYRSLKPGNVGHPLTDTAWWFCIINLSSIKAESDRIAALNQPSGRGAPKGRRGQTGHPLSQNRFRSAGFASSPKGGAKGTVQVWG